MTSTYYTDEEVVTSAKDAADEYQGTPAAEIIGYPAHVNEVMCEHGIDSPVLLTRPQIRLWRDTFLARHALNNIVKEAP